MSDLPQRTVGEADSATAKNLLLLVQLRWIAVLGQIATVLVVQFGLGVDLPLPAMGAVLLALVALNLLSLIWLERGRAVPAGGVLTVLLLDVAALTAQLYFSGGATNPFVFLFLLQATLGAVLLDTRGSWIVVAAACACFASLIPLHRPLALDGHLQGENFTLYILGLLLCFALNAALLAIFVTRIGANLRARDARVAALKQQAAEEDHIVRMGLLASGAAHELGTPLATLAVILNDWARMPRIAGDAELAPELEDMRAAVARCKSIVTGILLSSGEARGEAPGVTGMRAFLDKLAADWQAARSVTGFTYDNRFGTDLPIVGDPALQQVLFNVLDNAYEAAPRGIVFTVLREREALVLRVADSGPGFSAPMLEQLGRPYRSSKGRKGGGLGLFLVVNTIRKLGGSVTAHNRPAGGAEVTVTIPLARLAAGDIRHGA